MGYCLVALWILVEHFEILWASLDIRVPSVVFAFLGVAVRTQNVALAIAGVLSNGNYISVMNIRCL